MQSGDVEYHAKTGSGRAPKRQGTPAPALLNSGPLFKDSCKAFNEGTLNFLFKDPLRDLQKGSRVQGLRERAPKAEIWSSGGLFGGLWAALRPEHDEP